MVNIKMLQPCISIYLKFVKTSLVYLTFGNIQITFTEGAHGMIQYSAEQMR